MIIALEIPVNDFWWSDGGQHRQLQAPHPCRPAMTSRRCHVGPDHQPGLAYINALLSSPVPSTHTSLSDPIHPHHHLVLFLRPAPQLSSSPSTPVSTAHGAGSLHVRLRLLGGVPPALDAASGGRRR